MAQNRLSACMVLYHSGDQPLKALACLDSADLEVDTYIVDNSPGDLTAQQIRWLYPGVIYRPMQENVGFGSANNAILRELSSDYHLMLNPDVRFEPDLLNRMIAYMDENPAVAILTPRVLNEDGTEQFLPKMQPSIHYLLGGFLEAVPGPFKKWRRTYTMADRPTSVPIQVQFATGCFMLIRTEIFKRLNGFDERFFLYQEDSDLSRRALEEGHIIYHPDMVITHSWQRDNQRSLKGVLRQAASVCKFFAKWGVSW